MKITVDSLQTQQTLATIFAAALKPGDVAMAKAVVIAVESIIVQTREAGVKDGCGQSDSNSGRPEKKAKGTPSGASKDNQDTAR